MKKSGILLGALVAAAATSAAFGQYAERRELVGPGVAAVDASGRSIKDKRVRAVHTENPDVEGGTAYLQCKDPFLAYQLGRSLIFREFRLRDGLFSHWISDLAGTNPDGVTAKITANNHTSCLGCHSLPYGNPGGGPNFSKDSGFGRNTPHFYGAGIMEMLAFQIRAEILRQLDKNHNGWIEPQEANASNGQLLIRAWPGGPVIDFGDPRLTRNYRGVPDVDTTDTHHTSETGRPNLNNIFNVWYVDKRGVVVDDANEIDGQRTFGYKFSMMVWGWGQGRARSFMNPTNRAFIWDPLDAHSGLQAYDPSTMNDPDGDGESKPTLAGAPQFPITNVAPDCGLSKDPLGFSRDDPDGDGYLNEISEGDLDLGEWYMLNVPRPAFAGTDAEYNAGVALMDRFACTSCHVKDWQIAPQDRNFAGDRRIFDLDVRWNDDARRLEGHLIPLYRREGEKYFPKRGGFFVKGLFTDFKHHYLGRESAETDFGGTLNEWWRTSPLWGVGSGFPWHHDGASLSLEESIRRHGGEASDARARFLAAPAADRERLLQMLQKLVLYDIEGLPADINQDGKIDSHFMVAGQDTGTERFNAEWLFRVPLQIQGDVRNEQGVVIKSFAGVNIPAAYGENLALRKDSDDDGWPDVWDHAPNQRGYMDGVSGGPYDQKATRKSMRRPIQSLNRKLSCKYGLD